MLLNLITHRLIIILCLISTVARFALDSFLPSLPGIGDFFDLSAEQTQLVITLYLTGFGCSQLLYGPLSDRFGRKRVLLSGFTIFILGNLIAASATSFFCLLLGRLIAGFGCGAAGVINRAIARDKYRGAAFAKAWSYTTTSLVVTLIIAPVIGGYIQGYYGWRANIMGASIYVAFILLIVMSLLEETNVKLNKQALKFHYMLSNYFDIICHKQFIGGVLCYTLAFAGLIVYFQVSPFLFMENLNLSAVEYGWLALVIASCYFLGGILVKKFVAALGVQRMLEIGINLLILSGVLALLCGFVTMQIWTILLPTIIYVLGARIIIPNAISCCLEGYGQCAGFASGMLGAIQMLGTAIVSVAVAQFTTETQLPLALCFISMGVLSRISFRSLFSRKLVPN